MKNIFLLLFLVFLFSCGENKPKVNLDSLKTDSALRAQLAPIPPSVESTDTAKTTALPMVFEGDIIMQISEDPQHLAFGKACGSKYNNAGVIFIRPKDRMYMVMEVKDSIVATPLKDWAARGQGEHVALLRLKNSNKILDEKKTMQLKKGAKLFPGRMQDNFYSWSDDEIYSTELVWKLYSTIKIDVCETGKLSDMDMTVPLINKQMKKKHGAAIPKEEKFVSPEAIYKSPNLVIVYER